MLLFSRHQIFFLLKIRVLYACDFVHSILSENMGVIEVNNSNAKGLTTITTTML